MRYHYSLALLVYQIALILPIIEGESLDIEPSTLKQVVALVRHGARYSNSDKLVTDYEKQFLGELNPVGRRQQYQLGQILRKLYCDDTFLPQIYDSHSMYIRATDNNRTLESASSFLQGFYPTDSAKIDDDILDDNLLPPFNDPVVATLPPIDRSSVFKSKTTSIPYHSMPQNIDLALVITGKACKAQHVLFELNLKSKERADLADRFKPLLQQLPYTLAPLLDESRPEGPFSFDEAYEWHDALMCRRYLGMQGIKQKDIDVIKQFYDPSTNEETQLMKQLTLMKEQEAFILYFNTRRNVQLTSSQFMSDLTEIFTRRAGDLDTSKGYKTKFIGLFAHDTTVKMVLRALETVSWECINDFASGKHQANNKPCFTNTIKMGESVIFELRESNQEQNLFVSIRFNGEYIRFGCSHNQDGSVVYSHQCILNDFMSFLSEIILPNLEEECDKSA